MDKEMDKYIIETLLNKKKELMSSSNSSNIDSDSKTDVSEEFSDEESQDRSKRVRIKKFASIVVPSYSEKEIKKYFRLPKNTIHFVENVSYANKLLQENNPTEDENVFDFPKGSTSTEKDTWSKNEALALIASYKSRCDELDDARNRKNVWNNISNDLLSVGITKSSKSCAIKWKNMVRTYKSVKGNMKKTGKGTSRFLFYDEMDDVLGDKSVFNSAHSYESGVETIITNDRSNDCKIEKVPEEAVQISDPGCSKSDTALNDASNNTEVSNKQFTSKRKRENTDDEFLNLQKEALLKKTEYYKQKMQLPEAESRRKEEREERKLRLLERQLDIEERKVNVLEQYLANKK